MDIRGDEVYERLLRGEGGDEDARIGGYELDQRKLRMQQKTREFISKIREANAEYALQRKRRHKEVPLSAVLQEDPLPEIVVDTDFFAELFEPRRRLRPKAKERSPSALQVSKCNLVIQVVRAQGVPVRREAREGNTGDDLDAVDDLDDEDLNELQNPQSKAGSERVLSFVDIQFQRGQKRTSAVEGPSPTWKETLVLPFLPPQNDFSPLKLQNISDDIHINLYDEVLVDRRDLGGHYKEEKKNFVHNDKRFLGSLTIPFSTVYLSGKVDGIFRLERPLTNLGYDSGGTGAVLADAGGQIGAGSSAPFNALSKSSTYLRLLATLDPPLATPERASASNIPYSNLEREIAGTIEKWKKRVKGFGKYMQNRNLQVMVDNVHGQSVFICRYLTSSSTCMSQQPPPQLEPQSVSHIVRFVSLIPFLDDWHPFFGETDMWCSSQQFLDLGVGDWEEHAILLYNYFSYIDRNNEEIENYLVVGQGIPEGDTVCVYRRNMRTGEGVFWNASTGQGFDSEDPLCPIVDVSLLIQHDNVWANVQQGKKPKEISLDVYRAPIQGNILNGDFSSTSFWIPLFEDTVNNRDKPDEIPTIQEQLNYNPIPREFVIETQTDLENTLKLEIRKWRSEKAFARVTTSFDQEASKKLRRMLQPFERVAQGVEQFDSRNHEVELQSMSAGREVNGVPINVTFTDVAKVVQAVKNTNIHTNLREGVRFALAVQVYAYVNEVCSVWVYFASLVPK